LQHKYCNLWSVLFACTCNTCRTSSADVSSRNEFYFFFGFYYLLLKVCRQDLKLSTRHVITFMHYYDSDWCCESIINQLRLRLIATYILKPLIISVRLHWHNLPHKFCSCFWLSSRNGFDCHFWFICASSLKYVVKNLKFNSTWIWIFGFSAGIKPGTCVG